MSYLVLARKWRPQKFADMVGQEHVLRMLSNALLHKRVHHAYLFTGTRGIGKTTIARIFAKCLNCENGITAEPCNSCRICESIDRGKFLDLYEVDAASRTKVEDTRELLDNVQYPPNEGRYKIYLIDEVHMLSNHSFNALLKTLEEPPAHVKFLLATTDPKRLPITILSRCLQFHLKRIAPEKIADQLAHICQTEAIRFDAPALAHLAKAADGSMRDALSLLDQAIAYGEGAVLENEVNDMLGSVAMTDVLPLVAAIAAKDGRALFAAADKLSECAPDFNQLLETLIHVFHDIAMAQVVSGLREMPSNLMPFIAQFSAEEIQVYYQIALLGRRDLALSPSPQHGFEMTLLRMLALSPQIGDQAYTPKGEAITPPLSTQSATLVAESKTTTSPQADIDIDWRDLLQKLGLSGMAFALASNCTLVKIDKHKIELALSPNHQPMLNPKLKNRIEEALSNHFKKAIHLDVTVTAEPLLTPAKQLQQEEAARLANAKETILQDPKIQKLLEMYDATVEVSLVS